MSSVEAVWERLRPVVLNNAKVYLLKRYAVDLISQYGSKIDIIVNKYARYLPFYVASSERDDLRTISQLEFFETVKAWDPEKNKDIWPLAQMRITGAMKDHIRYVTRTDPTRLFDWIADAAQLFLTVNSRGDFESKIESGSDLNCALSALTSREQKIVIAHTRQDLTFKKIGQQVGVSESQVSRIYNNAIKKLRKKLSKS